MNDKVKIIGLEVENVKRIKAVAFQPTENGLTIIGGDNAQGKTSVIDSIAWALGGDTFKPTNPSNDNGEAYISIKLSNGLLVERTGKNASLKVSDPENRKYGQKLLDSFIDELALNLPEFMQAKDKEKALVVLKILGIEKELQALDELEKTTYDERTLVGREKEKKEKHAGEMPFFADVPELELLASEIIERQKEANAFNAENAKVRNSLTLAKQEISSKQEKINAFDSQTKELESELVELEKKVEALKLRLSERVIAKNEAVEKVKIFENSVAELQKQVDELPSDKDISTFKRDIEVLEETNGKVRANKERLVAVAEAKKYADEYEALTVKVEKIRSDKLALLNGAKMPLEGLAIVDAKLMYKGQEWGDMSGAEHLIVACSICKSIKPQCGFVLMDKLEAMDTKTLETFNEWLVKEGLQVIATRVSKGDECSIIIEDGRVNKTNQQSNK